MLRARTASIRRWAGLCIVLAGIAAAWHTLLPAGPRGPRLRLPQYPLHLGEGGPSEIVKGKFELRNVGQEPLTFSIAASCGCAELEPQSGSIASGGKILVGIGVKLHDYVGSERDVRLAIETNDTRAPVSYYQVSAHCPAPLRVSPLSINFGQVLEGGAPEIPLRLQDAAGRPLLGSLDDIVWKSDSPWVRAVPQTTEDGELYLAVSLCETTPQMPLAARLEVKPSGAEHAVTVSVTATVVGAIAVAPQTVALRRTASHGTWEGRVIVWRTEGGPLGDLVDMVLPEALAVEEVDAGVQHRRMFVIKTSDLQAVPENPVVRLSFESHEGDVAIPVHIAAMPDL